MSGRVTKDQVTSISAVLNNPESAVQLTPGQLARAREILVQYQGEQKARRDDLTNQGFDEDQIGTLMEAENTAGPGRMTRQAATPQGAAVGTIARGINAGLEGAWQAVEGLGDLVNSAAVGLNLQEPEDAQRYRDAVRRDRVTRKLSDIENFGKVNNKWVELAGQSAPWVVGGQAGAGGGIIRYAMAQGLLGGTAATAQVSDRPIEERTGDFLIGSALGTGLGAAFGVPAGVRRLGARAFLKNLNSETSANNLELERAVTEMVKEKGFGFSLSQITGNRFLFSLEQRAAGDVKKAAQNKNMQMLYDHVLKKAKQLGDQGRSADEIGLALKDTLSAANRAIHKKAGQDFAEGLDALEEFGEDIILTHEGASNYLGKLDDMIGELDHPLRPGAGASAEFKAYRHEVDKLVNPAIPKSRVITLPDGGKREVWDVVNRRSGEVTRLATTRAEAQVTSMQMNEEALGGFQAGETRQIQLGLNDLLRGKTAVLDAPDPSSNKHVAKALLGSLFDELDANAANPKAVQMLNDVTEAYKAQMLRIGKMEELVVNRMFGQAEMPFDSDKALKIVLGGGESSLKNTRAFLEEWDPALLDELQGTYLRRILEQAGDAASASVDVPISLTKFANALSGMGEDGKVVGQVGRGLFDEATQADLVLTANALRTIKNNYFTGINPSPSTIDDLAINVISRSPEFMGRFLTRVMTSGSSMEAALTDPLVRKAIQEIAKSGVEGPITASGRTAMLVLTNYLTANEAREEEQQGAAANQRAQDQSQMAARAVGQ